MDGKCVCAVVGWHWRPDRKAKHNSVCAVTSMRQAGSWAGMAAGCIELDSPPYLIRYQSILCDRPLIRSDHCRLGFEGCKKDGFEGKGNRCRVFLDSEDAAGRVWQEAIQPALVGHDPGGRVLRTATLLPAAGNRLDTTPTFSVREATAVPSVS